MTLSLQLWYEEPFPPNEIAQEAVVEGLAVLDTYATHLSWLLLIQLESCIKYLVVEG